MSGGLKKAWQKELFKKSLAKINFLGKSLKAKRSE